MAVHDRLCHTINSLWFEHIILICFHNFFTTFRYSTKNKKNIISNLLYLNKLEINKEIKFSINIYSLFLHTLFGGNFFSICKPSRNWCSFYIATAATSMARKSSVCHWKHIIKSRAKTTTKTTKSKWIHHCWHFMMPIDSMTWRKYNKVC